MKLSNFSAIGNDFFSAVFFQPKIFLAKLPSFEFLY